MLACRATTLLLIFGIALIVALPARADSAGEACAALVNVRGALYAMISAKDRSAQDALNAKVQAASKKLDSMLENMPAKDAKLAADFKIVWDQFKTTRENEIIPAIQKGNTQDAKKIADGIQLQRLSQMWKIMSCKTR
jgi:Skp family chaperone for outer membrane proteins